jgi:hypothetical protein
MALRELTIADGVAEIINFFPNSFWDKSSCKGAKARRKEGGKN